MQSRKKRLAVILIGGAVSLCTICVISFILNISNVFKNRIINVWRSSYDTNEVTGRIGEVSLTFKEDGTFLFNQQEYHLHFGETTNIVIEGTYKTSGFDEIIFT